MFGYVVAERTTITQEALQRYQSCYCGLCRCIGQTYGSLQRAALNYDMTFLVLLLSSLYEPEEQAGIQRCIAHPVSSHPYWITEVTQYAAAMNMALAYHNCMDDWHDEHRAKAYLLASLFRHSAASVKQAYPRQWHSIETCMQTLQEIEQEDLQNPDAGANAFGTLMSAIFAWKEDRWTPLLEQLGHSLGRFIYLLDALLDLPDDAKNGAYNPFRERYAQGLDIHDYLPVLKMLMGECTDALERLPLLQDMDLLRNILYAGVWTKLNQQQIQSRKEGNHV